MFNKIVLIFALFAILTGCNQQQSMMKPVMQDVLMAEPKMDDSDPATETPAVVVPPVEEIEAEVHPGFFQTIEAFTTAEAAFESQKFQDFLEYAKEYNAEWCDKLERAFGEDIGDIDRFEFTNQLAALEFLSKAHVRYPDDIKDGTTET